MSFQDDLDTDLDSVFFDSTGYGYAEAVTYKVDGQGSGSTIYAIVIEQVFAITDNRANKLFFIKSADVASPNRGDVLVHGSDNWQVVDIQSAEGHHELRCLRQQARQ